MKSPFYTVTFSRVAVAKGITLATGVKPTRSEVERLCVQVIEATDKLHAHERAVHRVRERVGSRIALVGRVHHTTDYRPRSMR